MTNQTETSSNTPEHMEYPSIPTWVLFIIVVSRVMIVLSITTGIFYILSLIMGYPLFPEMIVSVELIKWIVLFILFEGAILGLLYKPLVIFSWLIGGVVYRPLREFLVEQYRK